jgi:hypothetical protein
VTRCNGISSWSSVISSTKNATPLSPNFIFNSISSPLIATSTI